MSAVSEAAEALEAALETVADLRVYTDPGAAIDPPGAILGPPALEFEAYCLEPTKARFLIYLVVKANDRAMEQFWELIELVSAAVDENTEAAVLRAEPGTWNSGGTELPAYIVTTEGPL